MMENDWASEISYDIAYGVISRQFLYTEIAKLLREARAEGLRMAAEIAHQELKDWASGKYHQPNVMRVVNNIRAAADKEGTP